jgi:hypothetical protein
MGGLARSFGSHHAQEGRGAQRASAAATPRLTLAGGAGSIRAMEPRAGARVLLLELQTTEPLRHSRSELFPFLSGHLRARGDDARWWVLRVPPACMHAGGRFVVELDPARQALLLEALRAWPPAVLLLTDRPAPALEAALRTALPGATLHDLSRVRGLMELGAGSVDRLLSGEWTAPPPAGEEPEHPLLADMAQPCHERRFLRLPGEAPEFQPVRLMSDEFCAWRGRVGDNRFYHQLDDAEALEHRGCSFCPRRDTRWVLRTRPTELALRQIEAHQRAQRTNPEPEPLEYLVGDASQAIVRVLKALAERGLRPTTLYAMARADEVISMRPRLERVLPAAATAGHRLRLVSIGAENFSDDENERFNKGLNQEQVWRCVEAIRELEARFPDTFACPEAGYFSAILWTPWTRPADLRPNLEAGRRLGREWLTRLRGTRLQLRPGLPIAGLARADGLVVDGWDAANELVAVCLSSPDESELPWRFADPRTWLLYRWLVRLDPLPPTVTIPDDDPLRARLVDLQARLPDRSELDDVDLGLGLVGAVEALGPGATPEQAFERVLREWLEAHPPEAEGVLDFRRARAAERVVQELAARHPETLQGFSLRSTGRSCAAGQYAVLVSLEGPGGALALTLRARGAAGSTEWMTGGRFVLDADPALDPAPREVRLLGLTLLRLLERHVR